MQRRNFVKTAGLLATLPAIKGLASTPESKIVKEKEIYEWRHYFLKGKGTDLDTFYKNILIPAYNRQKITVGAFELYDKKETEERFFLFIYPDIATYHQVKRDIWKDEVFKKAAQPFYDTTAPTPLYSEFDSYLCEAFDKIPKLKMPDKNRTVFHLRHYHSPNEEANQRKVKMFNEAEMDVFDKVGIHPVCYGDVLAGPHMPALMYLTWYKDKPTHDASWKAFGEHPGWHAIKDLPEYAYTATNNTNRVLLPMNYSQI